MNKLFLTLIGCLIFFEAKTNQIASQLKCNGKLEGVTIDSRGDNKSTIDSISDNGDIRMYINLIHFLVNSILTGCPVLWNLHGPLGCPVGLQVGLQVGLVLPSYT